jgi:anti-sigma-K factor RskA
VNEIEHEVVGTYLLDALSPEDRALFEDHLRNCAACRAEVAELRQIVDVLPLAVYTAEPSPELRARIVEAVTSETETRPTLTALHGGTPITRARPSTQLVPRLLAAAAVAAILALGIWNLRLQQQINRQQRQVAYQQQIRSALVSGAAVSQIPGTRAAASASAAVVQPPGGKRAYLILQGLPATPAHKVYELWLIRGTVPRGVRVFTYNGSSTETIQLPVPATGFQIAAVTAEPGPRGSRRPTGPQLLAGRVRV